MVVKEEAHGEGAERIRDEVFPTDKARQITHGSS